MKSHVDEICFKVWSQSSDKVEKVEGLIMSMMPCEGDAMGKGGERSKKKALMKKGK